MLPVIVAGLVLTAGALAAVEETGAPTKTVLGRQELSIGSFFDIDSGVFEVKVVAAPSAFPRTLVAIERSCSCLDVFSEELESRAILAATDPVSLFGVIRPEPSPGRHRAQLRLQFAPANGGSTIEELPLSLVYNTKPSFVFTSVLPTVLTIDHQTTFTWQSAVTQLRPGPPAVLSVRGPDWCTGSLMWSNSDATGGTLALEGTADHLGESEVTFSLSIGDRRLTRSLRLVVKHPLLTAASVPVGFVSRGRPLMVRIPLDGGTSATVKVGEIEERFRAIFEGVGIVRDGVGYVLHAAYIGTPGPFRASIPLIIEGHPVPLILFGIAE